MIPRYLIDFDLNGIPHYKTDVIVIGAGIAGLYTSIKASENKRVVMVTKKTLFDSNTRYAQGGIAAVISPDDSPAYHRQDTLIAGAGLCSPEAVDVLVHEGPELVDDLIRLGAQFDLENGSLALTMEGGHSQRRVLHANGDASGYEIVRALSIQADRNPNIEIWDNHFVIDLITHEGACCGVLVQKPDGTKVYIQSDATVICAGGSGQLYRYTTNPDIATGDGIAIAYRAGADIRGMEFIQFHPTALCYPGAPRFLISEAVRGEGAILRNVQGERFMPNYHPQMELASRDIVSRAIVNELERTKSTFVYIDITHVEKQLVKRRFPTIYEFCLKYGLDLTNDWIPVAPAAHYIMGGIKTGLFGETNISRLFACGEASSTGVHGANRLASNSLSEAIVFGRRIVEKVNELSPLIGKTSVRIEQVRTERYKMPIAEKRLQLQKLMVRYVGLKRSAKGLVKGLGELKRQMSLFDCRLCQDDEYEYANLLTCALLTTEAALRREESRGGHYREDFPERDDLHWRKQIVINRKKAITEEGFADV